jgi:hypothetical protein
MNDPHELPKANKNKMTVKRTGYSELECHYALGRDQAESAKFGKKQVLKVNISRLKTTMGIEEKANC